MALYRHTSTGFLGEFASDPGAGYTAISAMPTDTIANRVAWWRGLDTFGQTSSWHPSVYRGPEDPAEAILSLQFGSSGAFISADANGTVTDAYLGATTTIKIFRGGSDVTVSEGWALTKVDQGCASTLILSGGVYTLAITNIPLLATTTGYVRVTATRSGSTTQIRDFNFIKVIRGANGTSGTNGTNGTNGVRGSRQLLVTNATGTWSDQEAWNGVVTQTGTAPVLSDLVTIAKTDGTTATSKFYAGGGNGTTTFGTWTTPSAYINGNLLVTGSIGTNQIAANAVTAAKIAAGTITADRLAANTITAQSGVIASLDANVITTGTLNASAVAVTNLNAANISGGTLSVDRISANSINGTKIGTGVNGIATGNIQASAVTYAFSIYQSLLNVTGSPLTLWTPNVPAVTTGNRGRVTFHGAFILYRPNPTLTETVTAQLSRGGVTLLTAGATIMAGQVYALLPFHYSDLPTAITQLSYVWTLTYPSSVTQWGGSAAVQEFKR